MGKAQAKELESAVMEIDRRTIRQFVKKREKKIAEYYLQTAEDMGLNTEGLNVVKLQKDLFEPLTELSSSVKKYSAVELLIVLEFYSDQIEKINEKTLFPPQLEQYCRLLGISTNTFKQSYLNSNDDNLRNAAQQVVDFISMTLSYGGMTRQIDNTAQIFVQKSSLNRKDNEQPVVNNNTNNLIITPEEFQEQLKKLSS